MSSPHGGSPEVRLTVAAPVLRVVQVGRVVLDLPGRVPVPRLDTQPFVGRTADLAALDAAGPEVVLVGAPGIGATRLACEWAARAAAEVLLVDVADGSCPIRRALLDLGAPAVPADHDSRTGMLRSLLRQRPVPVVLDGLAAESLARPFRTGTAPVVVTSHVRLPGLAVDGWRHVHLAGLAGTDAVAVLAAVTGWAGDDALAELARVLGGSPAVLRLVGGAARTATGPDELLGALSGAAPVPALVTLVREGVPASGRPVLQAVLDSRARVVTAPEAAALTGLRTRQVTSALDDLAARGLLQRAGAGFGPAAPLREPPLR